MIPQMAMTPPDHPFHSCLARALQLMFNPGPNDAFLRQPLFPPEVCLCEDWTAVRVDALTARGSWKAADTDNIGAVGSLEDGGVVGAGWGVATAGRAGLDRTVGVGCAEVRVGETG